MITLPIFLITIAAIIWEKNNEIEELKKPKKVEQVEELTPDQRKWKEFKDLLKGGE